MKPLILILFTLSFGYSSSGQGLPDFDAIRLDDKSDYKAAEPYALQASTFLLSTPPKKDDFDRSKSFQFIIKWMSGTPDYSFALDEVASKIMKGNDEELLGLYMAAMAKFVLENKESAGDQKLIKLNAITTLLTYCEDPANNIKMSKSLKKLSEAKAAGNLEEAL